jgi:hypothetical protein
VLCQQLDHCTPIYVEFRLPGGLQTLYCPAHVVWSKDTMSSVLPGRGTSFLMGIEFVRPPRAVRKALKRFIAERLKVGGKSTAV